MMINDATLNIKHAGKLFLVSTPIGNRKDITLRALETLKMVDEIAAEDTRHTRLLLQHYGISKPLLSLHAHNEEKRTHMLLEKLHNGVHIALVSDAGTPLISDPGFLLVQQARQENIRVVPIPGPCALITALSASGIPSDHFFFAGFLPVQTGARQKRLINFQETAYTTIFYEAPHRILDLFHDMRTVLGAERKVVLAKELTKLYESFFQGTIEETILWLEEESERQKGEFVVLLEGMDVSNREKTNVLSTEHILQSLLKSLPLKQAVQLTVELTGEKKNVVYELALSMKSENGVS